MTIEGDTGDGSFLAPDFLDFIVALEAAAVDALLVGGYALAVHGVVRATADIEFFYRPTDANVRRLCTALHEFGAPPSVIRAADLKAPGMVTQLGSPPLRIDLLNIIDGVSFAAAWKGAVTVDIGSQRLRVIGLAQLRANKAASGRPKDLEDLRLLTERAKAGRRRR